MTDYKTMDRVRRVFGDETPEQSYEPLDGGSERLNGERIEASRVQAFSWTDYSVFLLLGVAMLWAW
jgi:equilibrative nucleoside transporter 1/2/3